MHFPRFNVAGCLTIASLAVLASAAALPGAQKPKVSPDQVGRKIFASQCASCHGANGEGTKVYKKPLAGSRTLADLARFIHQAMPPGPRTLPAPDSTRVAEYIYNAFYSPIAQARIRPARVALSRLTVRQFRNAVADLVGSFRSPAALDSREGLRGEYFKTSRHQQSDRTLERIDPEVNFDFGAKGPTPEQSDPYQFAMRWQGALLSPDTGEYEIIVRSEHAVQLWVNDMARPLIDATVKSGTENEYRASMFLLGGRSYPIRLDYSKGVQGVDNIAEVKKKPPAKSFVSLEWRRPKLPVEVIPRRCLSPGNASEVFAPATPFPPDDRSLGYERGTSVSKAWDEAATSAALETAAYVASHLRELAGAPGDAADQKQKIQAFCRQLVERAFRRPLTDEQARFYVDRRFEGAPDLQVAVKRVVILALMSPRFLYQDASAAKPDGYAVASRLAFGMWDSLPDSELLKAAAAGELATRDQVSKQPERMAQDPRTWSKLREFLLQWLKVDQVPDLVKDAKRFPGFDQGAAADLRSSMEIFLKNTVWNDRSDYRELMLSDKLYLNGRLAKLYGVNMPADAPFQPAPLNAEDRCGVLTQPYMLASFAYIDNSSPIHRGVLIARNLLGRTLQPPPAAFAPLAANLHPNLTTRQRVALQTKPAACNGCHGLINPLGFALEKYDAIGRVRNEENGKPVDATGAYVCRTGKVEKFNGAHDLADFLATSDEAHAAFVEKLFQYLTKQPIRAYGPHAIADLERLFEANQFSIRKLIVESVATAAVQR
jgi:mono/diheme cytochrome c family protein